MNSKALERRRDIVTALLLVVLTTLVFSDVLFGSGRFFIRDLSRYYYPTKSIVRSIVHSGEFPWWNPYYSAGQPIAANPEYEIFYPPGWLIFLPDYDLGFRLHILIHFYIAILGMFAFLRSLRIGRAGASFGAVAFALGGCFLSLVNLLPILFCAAWMPLFFLFARRFLSRPNRRDFGWAALIGGLQTLAGEPTTLIQTWVLLGAWAVWRALRHRKRARRLVRTSFAVTLLFVATIAVGCVQLIPAVDHAADSSRSRGFSFEMVGGWSMPPARLVELVCPLVFGRISYEGETIYWGAPRLYPAQGAPFLFCIYFGLLGTVLLPAAFLRRRSGSEFAALVTAASFLLAFGAYTPLYHWLYDARIVSSIRYPEKWALSGVFVLTVMAAIAFGRCARGDPRTLRISLLSSAAVLGATLAAAGASLVPGYPEIFSRVWGIRPKGGEWTGAAALKLELCRAVLLLGALRAVVVAALLAWRARASEARGWVTTAILLTVIDLGWIGLDVSPRISKSYYTKPAVAATLPRTTDRYRIFHEVDWYALTKTAQRYFSSGASVYWIVRNGLYPMTGARWGFRTVLERDYDRTALLPTVDFVDAMWKVRDGGRKDWAEIFMNMSNAWYRSRYRDFDKERARVKGRLDEAQPVDFVRETSAPRYYFADEIVAIHGEKDFVSSLIRKTYSPRVAFVEGPAFKPARGTVESVDERSSRISIDAESAGRSLLVMSVTPQKYWRATVDGRPAKLETVNIGFQGLELGPGHHRIEMRYRNRLIPPCGAASLVTTLVLLLLAVWRKPRRELRPAGA